MLKFLFANCILWIPNLPTIVIKLEDCLRKASHSGEKKQIMFWLSAPKIFNFSLTAFLVFVISLI